MDVTRSSRRRRSLLLLLGLAAGLAILFGLGLTLAASDVEKTATVAAGAPPTSAIIVPPAPEAAAPSPAARPLQFPAPAPSRPAAPAETPFAQISYTQNSVMGWYGANATVQFTVHDALGGVRGGGSGTARPDGWLDGVQCNCDIIPYDHVQVTSILGFNETVDVAPISLQIDPANDLVTGHVTSGVLPGSASIWVNSEVRQTSKGLDVTVDASGNFTANFSGQFDVQRADQVDVWFHAVDTKHVGATFYLLRPAINYAHDWVRVQTSPNAPVTVGVAGKGSCQGQANADGEFYAQGGNCTPSQPDIAPGDNVTIGAAGQTATVNPVGTIQGQVDVVQNTVNGNINAPGWSSPLYLSCEIWAQNGPKGIEGAVNPANGAYGCDFDSVGWDMKPGKTIAVRYAEPDGDSVINIFSGPYARANIAWDAVDGWFGPVVNVQFTVADGSGNPKGSGAGTAKPDGWMDGIGCNCDIAPGDHVHVTSGAGFDAELIAIDITGQVDLANDRVTGQMSGGVFPAHGYMDIKSEARGTGWRAEFDTDNNGSFDVNLAGQFDIQPGDQVHVWYVAPDGNQLGSEFYTLEVQRVDIMVNSRNINGFAPLGPVTITTATEERVLPGGWFGQDMNDPFLPGGTVTVKAGKGLEPVVIQIPAPFTASASSITDTVWGQVDNLNHKAIDVSLDGMGDQWAETDGQGRYSATFTDLPRGARGEVRYDSSVNGTYVGLHRRWQTPDLILEVDYGEDWVETTYDPGHTIWITVTNSTGTIKATNTGTTGLVPWWGGQTGYSTNMGGWAPRQPDIAPGDWVYGKLDNGATTSVRIGTITGNLNASQDTVAGAVTANWFTQQLAGWCSVWGQNGPKPINFMVNPNGGAYSCDFNTVGWDLRPGQQVAVYYSEPDGDHVINVFQAPYARANYGGDNVDGWFGPGVTVYFTVTNSAGNVVKGTGSRVTRPDGWMDGAWPGCDMVPGDRVHVTNNTGFDAWLDLIEISGWLDPEDDRVGGHMAGAANSQGNVNLNNEGSSSKGWGSDVTTDGNGDFSVDLKGQWDVQAGDHMEIWHYDANWNQVGNKVTGLRIEVNYGDDNIWGETIPGVPVAVEVAGKATCTGQSDSNGNFGIDTKACTPGQPDILPGDHVIVNAAGYTAELKPVGAIQSTVDVDANTVDGTITVPGYDKPLRGRCEVWTDNGPLGIEFWVDPDGGGYHCDFDDVGFDLRPYHQVVVRYFEPDGDSAMNAFERVHARANTTWDFVDGWFGPGVEVAVTVSSSTNTFKCSNSGKARSSGWLDPIWAGCDMVVGDKVVVTTNSGFVANLALIPIAAHVDQIQDRVTGQVTGGVFPAAGFVELFTPLKDAGWELPIDIGTTGAFAADFAGMADLQAGYWGTAWYVRPDGNQVGIGFESLKIEANYAHEWIAGATEPLATVDVTVQGKASCRVQADKDGWFATDAATWSPSQPDIQPGGAIIVSAAGFDKAINPVGTINGTLDLPQNTVAGTLQAPFGSQKLQVGCDVWIKDGAQPKTIWQEVQANGGAYFCDFDDVGWDLRAGQDVAVSYYEPDGDRVINVFNQMGGRVFLPIVVR